MPETTNQTITEPQNAVQEGQKMVECADCGEDYPAKDIVHINTVYDEVLSLCNDCYNDNWSECHNCGNFYRFDNDEHYYVESRDAEYCIRCYNTLFWYCNHCEIEHDAGTPCPNNSDNDEDNTDNDDEQRLNINAHSNRKPTGNDVYSSLNL